MSATNALNVTYRSGKGKGDSKKARRNGQVPAIVYGLGKENRSILVKDLEWKVLDLNQVHMLELKDDKGEIINVLIKDFQYDYLADTTLHIDFLEVDMNEQVTTSVALKPVGSAAGETQGGMFELMIHDIEISCLPNLIPDVIELDISGMGLDAILHASDIPLPEGLTLAGDPEQPICHVVAQGGEAEGDAEAEEE